MSKDRLNILAIVLLGMLLALALGAFAHAITDRTVALPATTLSAADEPLAPAQAKRAQPVARPKKKPKKGATRATTTTTTPAAPTTTDDHGGDDSGRGRGRGRGSDDSSGSGSGSSGSGGSDDHSGGDD
ncbi:MAG TPA: hypothetical protein VKA45_03185 [Gaiellaceae bacterium]|nr:hypothetical protein [Gaiellaceae bacterium]